VTPVVAKIDLIGLTNLFSTKVSAAEESSKTTDEVFMQKISDGGLHPDEFKNLQLSRGDFVQIMYGVATGLGIDLVEDCIADDVDFEQAIVKAMKLFEQKTPMSVKGALHVLSSAFIADLPKAVKACRGSEQEVEKVITGLSAFANPWDFFYKVGQKLTVNGIQIFGEINQAIGAFKYKDYKGFGTSIGTALKQVLLARPNPNVQARKDRLAAFKKKIIKQMPQISDTPLLVKGMIQGFGAVVADQCIQESQVLGNELAQIIKNMQGITLRTFGEAIAQASLLLMSTVPMMLKNCDQTKVQLWELIDTLAQFKDPEAFMYHLGQDLLINSAAIFQDSEGMVDEWVQGNWEKFGFSIGHILHLVLIGKDVPIMQQNAPIWQ